MASSPTTDLAAVERKLHAFFTLADPDQLHTVGSLLASYKGREAELFFALDEMYPQFGGWGFVRDAILGYYDTYQKGNITEADIDGFIRDFHTSHPDRPTSYLTGTFHRLWDEIGGAPEPYMIARRMVLLAIRERGTPQEFCVKATSLTSKLRSYVGNEMDYAKEVRRQVDGEFVSQLLQLHEAVPGVVEKHLAFVADTNHCLAEIESFKMQVVRACQPDYYLKFSTYCLNPAQQVIPGGTPLPAKNPDVFRHAATEFFNITRNGMPASDFFKEIDALLQRRDTENLVMECTSMAFGPEVIRLYRDRGPGVFFPPWRMKAFPDSLRKEGMGVHLPVDQMPANGLPTPWTAEGRALLAAMRQQNRRVYADTPVAPPPATAASPAQRPPPSTALSVPQSPAPANLSGQPLQNRVTLVHQRWGFRAKCIEEPLFSLVRRQAGSPHPHTYQSGWSDDEGAGGGGGSPPFEPPPFPESDCDFTRVFRRFDPPAPGEEGEAGMRRKEIWLKVCGDIRRIHVLQSVFYFTGTGLDPMRSREGYEERLKEMGPSDSLDESRTNGSYGSLPIAGSRMSSRNLSQLRSASRKSFRASSAWTAVASPLPPPSAVGIPEEALKSNRKCIEYIACLQGAVVTLGVEGDAIPASRLQPRLESARIVEETPPFPAEDDPIMPLPDAASATRRRVCGTPGSPGGRHQRGYGGGAGGSPPRVPGTSGGPGGAGVGGASMGLPIQHRALPVVPQFLCPSCSLMCAEARLWGPPEAPPPGGVAAAPPPASPTSPRSPSARPSEKSIIFEGKVELLKHSLLGAGPRKWVPRQVVASSGGVQWWIAMTDPKPEHSLPMCRETVSLVLHPEKKDCPMKQLHQSRSHKVFGLKSSAPMKVYWMRVPASDPHLINSFASCFDEESDVQERRDEDLLWKARAKGLRSQLAREMSRVARLREQAMEEQLGFAEQADRTTRSEAEKEWVVLNATGVEERVTATMQQLKESSRLRDKLRIEAAASASEHSQADSAYAALVGGSSSAEASRLAQGLGSSQAAEAQLHAKIAAARRARDEALHESQRIQNLLEGRGQAVASPNPRLSVASAQQPARPFFY